MTYSPKPGTAAFRILGWLEAQGATREFTASQIAEALGLTSGTVPSYLESALAAHLLFSRRRDYTHPKAPIYYSLTDHGIRQRMEMRPGGVGWMSPPPKSDDDVPTFRGRATTSNSQRHESGAQTDPNATGNGNMARNTEHAAPLGGPAEGEGASAPSPGLCGTESAAQQEEPPNPGSVEPAAPPAAPPLPPLVREEPREVDEQFARSIDAALADPEMRFALWDDGHLICMVNGAIAWRCNPEQTERLRALLGGR